MVQLSCPFMTTGKTIALSRWTFVGKVMSLLFDTLSIFVIAFLPKAVVNVHSNFRATHPPPPKYSRSLIASSFCPFLPLHLGLQPGISESGMEAEEPGSLQDILQQKLGSRRMAGGCLCSGAKCRPRVRQARSPPGAGEKGKRPRHPKNEVCVTAARCSLPGAGARETLAEMVGLLQPLILVVSPLKQWEAAPPHLGLRPSCSPLPPDSF